MINRMNEIKNYVIIKIKNVKNLKYSKIINFLKLSKYFS